MDKGRQTQELVDRVLEWKERRKAVILSHNYQRAEIQDIADFVADSLELSRKAAATDAEVIVFCGVRFMAETAAILAPDKIVLMPDPTAGCPMADMVNTPEILRLKSEHPGAPVVCYVNTSAAAKAECDVCCTSANAVSIIKGLDASEVIFLPDKSLGEYCAERTDKRLFLYQGYCPTHHRILAEDILERKAEHRQAVVMVHPECTSDVIALADVVLGTGGMCRYVRETSARAIIVGTENGIIHRLKKENPDIAYVPATYRAVCPNMKKITLEKVLWSLEDMETRITVPEAIAGRARKAIERMVA